MQFLQIIKKLQNHKQTRAFSSAGIEYLPYKQVVVGSTPTTPIEIDIFGPVVQSVRTLACQARGREFEPRPVRHIQPAPQEQAFLLIIICIKFKV